MVVDRRASRKTVGQESQSGNESVMLREEGAKIRV